MTNIAYTKEYQAKTEEYERVFAAEYLVGSETFTLSIDYKLEKSSYCRIMEGCNIAACENKLLNTAGEMIYSYRNIDDNAEFHTLIEHSNGHTYLIFRTDLYGYGVFDLTDKKDFHYIPKEAETFIWTEIFYNSKNNILIVSGCFWAFPYGTIMLDFSNPILETKWVDIHDKIDSGYCKYYDIDFVRWDGDSLILRAEEEYECGGQNKSRNIEIVISKEQYTQWLFNL